MTRRTKQTTYAFDSERKNFVRPSLATRYDVKWYALIETFYGTQHFDITASGSYEIDYDPCAGVVGGNGRRNTERYGNITRQPRTIMNNEPTDERILLLL